MNRQEKVDALWMSHALQEALKAKSYDEVPVGAIVVHQGRIIARGHNAPISTDDPTAHAEIVALRRAALYMNNYRLVDAELFVTIEPCMMCLGAMTHARIKRLVYGAPEPKAGVVTSTEPLHQKPWLNHHIDVVGGVLEMECRTIIRDFFASRRKRKTK